MAKDRRVRLWQSYEPSTTIIGGKDSKDRTFQAKVVEIFMGDAMIVKKGEKEYQKIWLSSVRAPRLDNFRSPPRHMCVIF